MVVVLSGTISRGHARRRDDKGTVWHAFQAGERDALPGGNACTRTCSMGNTGIYLILINVAVIVAIKHLAEKIPPRPLDSTRVEIEDVEICLVQTAITTYVQPLHMEQQRVLKRRNRKDMDAGRMQ